MSLERGFLMYQALYRKWRPKTFEDVVGQAHITETLKRQVAEGRLSHAYLFTGTRGTGKTTCAKILAKAVNCEHPVNGNPCNACASCLGIESGGFLDVLELDAASNNGVDQVRALRDEAVYAPANVRKRVYIIDEVHMLSTAAFNALLKILEEPPEHLMFILATTELNKVPATILSRCQRFSFRRITPSDIAARLTYVAEQERIDLSPDGAELLSRLADGALRDALSLLDQCAAAGGTIDAAAVLDMLGLAGNMQTAALMDAILSGDAPKALSVLDGLYRSGRDMGSVLSSLSALARDLLIMKVAPKGGEALLTGGYDGKTMAALGKRAGAERLAAAASELQDASARLQYSGSRRTDAELCILRLCDPSLSGDVTALAARVEKLEDALKSGAYSAPSASAAAPAETAEPVKKDAEPAGDAPPWDEAPAEAADRGDAPPPPSDDDAPPEEAPAPVRKAAAKDAPAMPSVGSDDVWSGMAEDCKNRLPVSERAFLNMAGGRLDGDTLVIECANSLFAGRLEKPATVAVIEAVASEKLGRKITVRVEKSKGAKAAPKKAAAKPQRAEKPADETPAEDESKKGGDKFDRMLDNLKGFDNITIK
jgi:DNA polymerase-3 subunit gamma/tau